MAYDYERELGNGKMEKMIRSRSTINTFFGQVDGAYYLGEKWLFTATVSAHQHLVRSIDKNIIPMDNQQPTDPNGNKTKVTKDASNCRDTCRSATAPPSAWAFR